MLRTKRRSFEMQVSPDPRIAGRLEGEKMRRAAKSLPEELDVGSVDRINDLGGHFGRDPPNSQGRPVFAPERGFFEIMALYEMMGFTTMNQLTDA